MPDPEPVDPDHEPIILVDYDPQWPGSFERERALLLEVIGEGFGVESIDHIGSTSVPGLAAKPIIDISIGVADLERARAVVAVLEALGYTYVPRWEVELPFRLFFCKGAPRTVQIHLTETDHPFRQADIMFRDYLREHADVVRAYEALKRRLAARHRDDRRAYGDAKTGFVMDVKRRAGAPKWEQAD